MRFRLTRFNFKCYRFKSFPYLLVFYVDCNHCSYSHWLNHWQFISQSAMKFLAQTLQTFVSSLKKKIANLFKLQHKLSKRYASNLFNFFGSMTYKAGTIGGILQITKKACPKTLSLSPTLSLSLTKKVREFSWYNSSNKVRWSVDPSPIICHADLTLFAGHRFLSCGSSQGNPRKSNTSFSVSNLKLTLALIPCECNGTIHAYAEWTVNKGKQVFVANTYKENLLPVYRPNRV